VRQAVSTHSSRHAGYIVLTIVSTVIAAYGLMANSAAVVIGAMLVAPLMGPIIGVAFGVATGDTRILRRAAATELVGVIIAVGLATLIGLVPLHLGYGSEILARTKPTLYDLIVALAAGLAAAYATIDPKVSPALVGVAIATALVPPLATCGICLAGHRWEWAGGAFLLFAANFLAIETVGAAAFIFVGLHRGTDADNASAATGVAPASPVRRMLVHIVALMLVGAYMTQTLLGLFRERRLTEGVRTVLRQQVLETTGAWLDDVSHEERQGQLVVTATVISPRPYEAASVARMESALRRKVDARARLIVRSVVSSDSDAHGPVFLRPEDERKREAVDEEARRLSVINDRLSRWLESVRGAVLVDVTQDTGGPTPVVTAVVRTPTAFGPEAVARAQKDLSGVLRAPVRLVVQSVLVRTADADGFLDQRSPPAAANQAESLQRQRWERVVGAALDSSAPGVLLAGLSATDDGSSISVLAAVLSPSGVTARQVGAAQTHLRLHAHPSASLRVRVVAAGTATATGYEIDPSLDQPLLPAGVAPVALRSEGAPTDPVLDLSNAAADGDEEAVDRLLSKGVDIGSSALFGWTPLHRAAYGGHTGVVKLLLRRGANPTARDTRGASPLHWAVAEGQGDVVRALFYAGADCGAHDSAGGTPSAWAATRGREDMVALLDRLAALR